MTALNGSLEKCWEEKSRRLEFAERLERVIVWNL
jgi:hypothetical protein